MFLAISSIYISNAEMHLLLSKYTCTLLVFYYESRDLETVFESSIFDFIKHTIISTLSFDIACTIIIYHFIYI